MVTRGHRPRRRSSGITTGYRVLATHLRDDGLTPYPCHREALATCSVFRWARAANSGATARIRWEARVVSTADGLGGLLVRLRAERDLGQKQLAALANIDNSTLSRLESNGRGVSREVLDRISDAMALNRRERIDLLVAANFLDAETARMLLDEDVARLAGLIGDPNLDRTDTERLRQFVSLALAYADARGLGSH